MVTVQVRQIDPVRINLYRSNAMWSLHSDRPAGYALGSAQLDHLPPFLEESSSPVEIVAGYGGLAVGVGEFVTRDTPDRVPFSYLDQLWGTVPILTWNGVGDRVHVNWRFLDLISAVLYP